MDPTHEPQKRTSSVMPPKRVVDGALVNMIIMLALVIITLALALMAGGCAGAQTVVPNVIVPRQASFDGNKATSGLISRDREGVHVTAHYLDRYDDLVATYGGRAHPPLRKLLRVPDGRGNYLITYEDAVTFITLNEHRLADPTP